MTVFREETSNADCRFGFCTRRSLGRDLLGKRGSEGATTAARACGYKRIRVRILVERDECSSRESLVECDCELLTFESVLFGRLDAKIGRPGGL